MTNQKRIFDKPGLHLPVTVYASDTLMPSARAIAQLFVIAKEKAFKGAIVALPDIHDKEGNDFPTGVVAASANTIFPQLLVSGTNCGMRMITTPLSLATLKEEDIDRLFQSFVKQIKTRSVVSTVLSLRDMVEVMSSGACWPLEKASAPPNELGHIEQHGNALTEDIDKEEVLLSIPRSIINIGRSRLGFLGKGNHFLEMQVVEEIFDSFCAKEWGLENNQIVFLMHCGSGGFGALVGHFYTPRPRYTKELKMRIFISLKRAHSFFVKEHRSYLKRLMAYRGIEKDGLFSLEADSKDAKFYLTALGAAANFGYANRQFITSQVRDILARKFSLPKEKIKTLYDMSHMSINREKHNSDFLWVHRSGATRAFTSQMLPENSLFRNTGEPIFLPGSMAEATYLCVSQRANNETFYSAGHGSGRKPEESISSCSRSRQELKAKLAKRNVRLYKGLSQGIIKQDPACFKDVDIALETYTVNGLLKAVAKTRPIAVLKG